MKIAITKALNRKGKSVRNSFQYDKTLKSSMYNIARGREAFPMFYICLNQVRNAFILLLFFQLIVKE